MSNVRLAFFLSASMWAGQPLLVISVDGLDQRYLDNRDAMGLKIPHIRRMLAEGQWSAGVVGEVPTITWPSHTTLITGVSPSVHGILGNRRPNGGDYYWTVDLLKVPTLLDAAKAAGKRTATVTWPVTVNAPVTFNLPEYFQRRRGGSMDEERWPTATMGQVREQELMRSLAVLGVTEHHWLDCLDVDMDTALEASGFETVRSLMQEVQPDTVLTFGPDGMTGHVGHMSVSEWSTRAFDEVAKPGAKLYYATMTPEWAEEWVPIYNRFDVFRPGTPPVTPREELGIDYALPPDILELKLKAIEEHVSQVGFMIEAFGEDYFRRAMREETFCLVATKS